jgi:hypothetical protein
MYRSANHPDYLKSQSNVRDIFDSLDYVYVACGLEVVYIRLTRTGRQNCDKGIDVLQSTNGNSKRRTSNIDR